MLLIDFCGRGTDFFRRSEICLERGIGERCGDAFSCSKMLLFEQGVLLAEVGKESQDSLMLTVLISSYCRRYSG